MMKDMDPMKEALMKRRGKGLELSIIIGPGGEVEMNQEQEEKQTDLAPKPKMELEMSQEDQEPQEEEMDMDEELVSDMSEYDKEEMMSGHKPKSLGDRARMEALNRMKK